jgi:DNA-binding NarL/FixJ family response regulator
MSRNLTPRQAEILALVAAGLADKEIAVRLNVSVPTVRTHLRRLFRDRGYHNRAEAAVD